jgi:hypothetical protein
LRLATPNQAPRSFTTTTTIIITLMMSACVPDNNELCLYRIAAALNNVGVSAMERGAYRQASDCMKEAICIMKEILPTTGNIPTAHVRQAGIVLASRQREISSLYFLTPRLPVSGINFSDITPLRILALLEQGSSNMQALPIRIDSIEDLPFDMGAAILMFNNGIAHGCMWTMSRLEGSYTRAYNLCAYKLMDFSESILINTMEKHGCENQVYGTVVAVSSLVLRSTWHLLNADGRWEDAAAVYARYQGLARTIQELDQVSAACELHAAGAA